jgi:hypothetical protein
MHPTLYEAIKPGSSLLQSAQSAQSLQGSQGSQGTQNIRIARNAQAFFTPRVGLQSSSVLASRYRELLLAFIVSNNLPMSLVNQPSFRQLIH